MPSPEGLVTYLRESFVENATVVFWTWVFGLVGASIKYARARRRALSPATTNQWLGASLAIAGMLIITGVILWSVLAFGVILGVATLVIIAKAVVARSARSKERLKQYDKGQLDYMKDRKANEKKMVVAMELITKQAFQLASDIEDVTKALGPFDAVRWERLSNQLASRFKARAARIRSLAVSFRGYSEGHANALNGILDCAQENHFHVVVDTAPIVSTRDVFAKALESQRGARNNVLNMPRVTQGLNAAKAELAESIALSMEGFQITVDSCNSAIRRLGESKPPALSDS